MPIGLKAFYKNELNCYKTALNKDHLDSAWYHIERAHIIGQRYPLEHTKTHWKMLSLGWKTNDLKEILGQVIRLLLGAPFSLINKIPVGNVGSSRVSMIKPQRIPEDILEVFSQIDQ